MIMFLGIYKKKRKYDRFVCVSKILILKAGDWEGIILLILFNNFNVHALTIKIL